MKTLVPSRLRRLLEERMRGCRTEYRRRLSRCRSNCSERAVHALRVETRRMLALLDLLGQAGLEACVEKLARVFRKRLKVFGPLRDTQVQLRLLKACWEKFPEARGLKALLERREKKLGAKLDRKIGAMKGSSLNRRLKKLETLIAEGGPSGRLATSDAAATEIMARVFRDTKKLQEQMRPESPESVHQMRIAFKRFRYTSELLKPLFPAIDAARIKRMKAYQDSAGHIQDLDVLLARMARSIRDRKISPTAVRPLRKELQHRRHLAITSFLRKAGELDSFDPVRDRLTGSRKGKAA